MPLLVRFLEELEEPASFPDHHEESTTRVVVLRMVFQMVREFFDLLREEPDLHFRRTGVGVVDAVLVDDSGLFILAEHPHDDIAFFPACQKNAVPYVNGAMRTNPRNEMEITEK